MDHIVLVGVLKDHRDLRLLLTEHWYRMPTAYAPTRQYAYLAFYQPAAFGRAGKCIRYYARVRDCATALRRELLPHEPRHPRADDMYTRVRMWKIQRLPHPVRNIIPRRVTFGFTTLHRLRTARDLLELYAIPPIEQIVGDALACARIIAIPQKTITINKKRYRPDFIIPCARGMIAIECDNTASHRSARQKERDKEKDATMRRAGWTVIRLPESMIIDDLRRCMKRIKQKMRTLGGEKMTK